MITKINELYEKLNQELLSKSPLNDKQTKQETIEILKTVLGDVEVKCDDENNSPFIVDQNCLVARVSWKGGVEQKYSNLIFGRKEQVEKIKQYIV